ncbi:MAG TPA: protein-disulfide reductase DsbD domain-containing protein [Holophagaceae bacterium]
MDRRIIPLLALLSLHARAFDPAVDVALTAVPGGLRVALPAGAHLKQRTFKVMLASSQGRLAVGPLPPPSGRDEAGDPVWRGAVVIPLQGQGLPDPVSLAVTYQPCTEGPAGVCYLPQHRTVRARAADLEGGPAAGPGGR